ncbi:signal recognition particle-docking protein FtsY [Candidatus Woesearchaeota archaeon]|nr:signal recognition particle-docking protein FtsY [Candidatus Woesearchaeota archaeon]
MFGFLKDKLKEAIGKFSKKVDEEAEEIVEENTEEKSESVLEEQQVKSETKTKSKPEKKEKPISKKEKSTPKKLDEEVVIEKDLITSIEEVENVVDEEDDSANISAQEILESIDIVDTPKLELDEETKTVVEEQPVSEVVEDVNEVELLLGQEIKEHLVEKKVEKNTETTTEKEVEKKRSFFGKVADVITKKQLNEEQFENLFFDLEILLLENNVSFEVVEKIKSDLCDTVVNQKLHRGKILSLISDSLGNSINDLLSIESPDFYDVVKTSSKKPFKIVMIGVNGSGKTTSMAKLAYQLKQKGFSCCMAAGDTFRAAAIQQLEEHANAIDVKLIKQDYGADSAAVAYDAIKYAESKKLDVVLIDTAGRLHSNTNLMNELKKVIRVSEPDMKIFVGESITGNDCVEQATQFNEAVGIDGIILTKSDVDEKGGTAISVSYVTRRPILFLGVGQTYSDLIPFDKQKILDSLGF